MDLEAEASVAGDFLGGFLFRVVDGLEAVEPDLDEVALGVDAHLVPFAFGSGVFGEDVLGELGQHFASAGLVVEEAPDGAFAPAADVALVADHFMVVGDALAPELYAGIVAFADQAGFEA